SRFHYAFDVSVLVVGQLCCDDAAGAHALIGAHVNEAAAAIVSPIGYIAAFADFASRTRREEADVFVRPHQRPSSGREEDAAARIAQTFHFDQAFVNHHASVAGSVDGDAELSAPHQDWRRRTVDAIRIRFAADMMDLDAHLPDDDPEQIAQRGGGAVIVDDDARIRPDDDQAAVGQFDHDTAAAARINLVARD